jgi:hypothetical protein
MAKGSLKLRITDLLDEPVPGRVRVDFTPARESPGGASMNVEFDSPGAMDFIVTELECRGGPGTLYQVRVDASGFRPYGFFQIVMEDRVNKPSDNKVRLVADPKKIKDISAPAYTALHPKLREFLDGCEMIAMEPGDKDLVGCVSGELYDRCGALRKACLLNLFAKARHGSTARSFAFLRKLLVLRQDRCFCTVDEGFENFLAQSDRFKSAPNLLHKPLPGYELRASFKSRDPRGNIQFTLMRKTSSGQMAADVDIDEAMGIEHGFEVIRNRFKGRTNPFLVREIMLLTDIEERTLDPGYRFVFK